MEIKLPLLHLVLFLSSKKYPNKIREKLSKDNSIELLTALVICCLVISGLDFRHDSKIVDNKWENVEL
jgi:hypothetical protein